MPLETLSSNELPTCLVYDTISATPLQYHHHHQQHEPSSSHDAFVFGNAGSLGGNALLPPAALGVAPADARPDGAAGAAAGARRKRRRRQRSCKNKEEAESQRMTHIAVERNRRRLMNEHLNVLRSLMPESYIQRGDQASIVGGAINFVKELEQLLQSLEVQKRTLRGRQVKSEGALSGDSSSSNNYQVDRELLQQQEAPPFAQFFAYPQFVWCHAPPRDYSQLPPPPESRSAVADIEVTLTETHASVRVLTPTRPRQLLSMVAGLQSLRLSILHLNVTTLDSMVLYSLSIKVEEGCNLTTVDDIAAAVHHMLTLIEADATGLTQ